MGYRFANSAATVPPIATAVAANEPPSRPARSSSAAASAPTTGTAAAAVRHTPPSEIATVQTANTATRTTAGQQSRLAVACARSVTTPRVRRPRKVDPWVRLRTTSVRPIQTPYGVNRSQNDAGELLLAVDRQPGEQVAEGDAEHQRDQGRPDGERPAQGAAPPVGVDLRAPLERHASDDQRHQQQHQREVAGGEPGRVPGRERREDRRTAHDQPDLVAVPERADALDDHPRARRRSGRRPCAACRPRSRSPRGRRSRSRRTPRSRTRRRRDSSAHLST